MSPKTHQDSCLHSEQARRVCINHLSQSKSGNFLRENIEEWNLKKRISIIEIKQEGLIGR